MARKAEVREASSDEFDPSVLSPENITEKGEKITFIEGAQLVRIPDLEGSNIDIPLEHISPNPEQPRKYFNPERLQRTMRSIRAVGQEVPISVVPILLPGKGGVRLFIIDGERRFRCMRMLENPTIRATVKWVDTEEKLFKASLVINDAREGHNHIERAEAYLRMIGYKEKKGMTRGEAVLAVAEEQCITDQTVYNHLKILKLPPAIQEMVMNGSLPHTDALQICDTVRKFGIDPETLKGARLLVNQLNSGEESFKDDQEVGGEVSIRAIRAGRRQLLIKKALGEDIDPAVIEALDAKRATTHFGQGMSSAHRGAEALLGVDISVARNYLGKRPGWPAERVRASVVELREKLSRVLGVLDTFIGPGPLPEVPGKPKIKDFVMRRSDICQNDLRRRMMIKMGEASDKGAIAYTCNELAELLEADPHAVTSHIQYLNGELFKLGLCLDESVKREKVRRKAKRGGGETDAWEKFPAYRLKWMTENELRIAHGGAKAEIGGSVPEPEFPEDRKVVVAPKPTESAAPAGSAVPERPIAPTAKPAELVEPVKPAVPAKPVAPVKPAAPAKPAGKPAEAKRAEKTGKAKKVDAGKKVDGAGIEEDDEVFSPRSRKTLGDDFEAFRYAEERGHRSAKPKLEKGQFVIDRALAKAHGCEGVAGEVVEIIEKEGKDKVVVKMVSRRGATVIVPKEILKD